MLVKLLGGGSERAGFRLVALIVSVIFVITEIICAVSVRERADFSMQTFVVKLASGVSVFIAGLGLDLIGLQGNPDDTGPVAAQSASTLVGLRLLMTILPVIVLLIAFLFFRAKFKLTDSVVEDNSLKLKQKNS